MASREFRQLLDNGFSERFLRTPAGNHPALRQAFLRHQSIWQPCRNCGNTFVLISRIPEPVINAKGGDLRSPDAFNEVGFCSSACAFECWGDDAIAKRRAAKLAARKDFYDTKQWRELRYQVLARHGNRCQCCGRRPSDGAVMHVDHIKPKYWRPELALTLENLQVLCDQCNLGKGMHDDTDWREVS